MIFIKMILHNLIKNRKNPNYNNTNINSLNRCNSGIKFNYIYNDIDSFLYNTNIYLNKSVSNKNIINIGVKNNIIKLKDILFDIKYMNIPNLVCILYSNFIISML